MADRFIVVTGGAGHVGSHVVEQLVADPANRVVSLDNYFTGSPENHVPGAQYVAGHTADIAALVEGTPDLVFHLGEYGRIAPSFEDVELVWDLNIRGTFGVAEFCRSRGVKLVYAASSTKFAVEGDGRHQSPYALSKATNVDLVTDYGRWYGMDHAICYFYNAFGPREQGRGPYATLIARFEQAYLAGEPLTVVRPGTQKRNFTWVGDLARGIIAVGERGHGDGYTLSNPHAFSVLEIAAAGPSPARPPTRPAANWGGRPRSTSSTTSPASWPTTRAPAEPGVPRMGAPRSSDEHALLRRGFQLEFATLGWNVVGVAVLAWTAVVARSVALAGFGLDSLIEIGASTVVIWELAGVDGHRRQRGMRLIAGAFVALAVYLAVQSTYVLVVGHRSAPSPVGVAWTATTAAVMFLLASGKRRTGTALDNPVLLSEGRVTLVDGLLATAVVAGLLLDHLLGWWWADPAAGYVLLGYAAREAWTVFHEQDTAVR
jgi:UDP-glucose 4-epimerase